jgi:trypsin
MRPSRLAGATFAVALAMSCSPPGEVGSGEKGAPIVGSAARADTTHSAVVAIVSNQGSLCSGTVIQRSEDGSTLSVLTAAHCCPENPAMLAIRVGADYAEPSRVLPVASFQKHPCYNGLSNDYDFCVLEVRDEGQLNITPIPLATRPDDFILGGPITFVGYGSTPALNSIRRWAAGRVIEVAPLTIGADQTDGLGGICFGDSGGPALVIQHGVEVIAGVASFVAPTSLCNVVGVVGRVAFPGIRDEFLAKVLAGERSALQSLLIQRHGLTPGAVRDTYIASDEPDRNFGTRVDLLVGTPPDSKAIRRALVRFDLSGIPAGATLLTARVGFHEESRTGAGTIEVHRVTKEWDELNETWSSFGEGGFDLTPIASSSNASAIVMISDQVWFDVTSVVGDWLAGKAGDHGILLNQPDQAQTQLLSSELGRTGERPWMHVCYLPRVAPAAPPQ